MDENSSELGVGVSLNWQSGPGDSVVKLLFIDEEKEGMSLWEKTVLSYNRVILSASLGLR